MDQVFIFSHFQKIYSLICPATVNSLDYFYFTWQRSRLEEQIKQHDAKRAALSPTKDIPEGKDKDTKDIAYDVTLDEDFLTSLEYGMPPASGMVCTASYL